MIRRFARPYATAMMQLAGSAENAQAIHAEAVRFENARRSSPELSELLANPAVEMKDKTAVVETIGRRLGLTDLTLRFLGVATRHHRIGELQSILEAWEAMIHAALGIVMAEVRTAHELSPEEREVLRGKLERKLGRKVELETKVDAGLLGGFVAKVGSEIYDASVLGRIEKLRHSIR